MLGPGRAPQLEDRPALPYTNAVLHEVQRYTSILPHVPRCAAADTQLGSYLVPKVGHKSSLTYFCHMRRARQGTRDPEMAKPGRQRLTAQGSPTGGRGLHPRRRAAPGYSSGTSSLAYFRQSWREPWQNCRHRSGAPAPAQTRAGEQWCLLP